MVVLQSALAVDGWIPVDPHTLETSFPRVYAVGDVTRVRTPKAGVFSEGPAVIVAGQISALIRGASDAATYDGRGICYLEVGHHEVAKVDVTFMAGERPHGELEGPSAALADDKADFGRTRVQRQFGREWAI